MRKLILLFLALTPIWAAGNRPVTVGADDKVIPQIAFGGTWTTTITLVCTYDDGLGTPGHYDLRFYDNDGRELMVPVVGVGNVNVLSGTIPYGGSRTFEIATSSPTETTGWAKLDFDWDKEVIAGMTVFRQRVPGRPDFEAVVPMSTEGEEHYVMPFDNTNGFGLGIALCNTAYIPSSVILTFKDEAGQPIGDPAILSLPSRGHTSFMTAFQYPSLANRRGTIDFSFDGGSSTGKINALGLRFNPSAGNPFTSVHTLEMYN